MSVGNMGTILTDILSVCEGESEPEEAGKGG
jgi:hypothetical protein